MHLMRSANAQQNLPVSLSQQLMLCLQRANFAVQCSDKALRQCYERKKRWEGEWHEELGYVVE